MKATHLGDLHKKVTLQTLPEAKEVDVSKIHMSIGLTTAAIDCIARGPSHPYTKSVLAQETLLSPEKMALGLAGPRAETEALARETVQYLEKIPGGKTAILALAAEELDYLDHNSPQRVVPTTTSGIPLSNEDISILNDVLKRREQF